MTLSKRFLDESLLKFFKSKTRTWTRYQKVGDMDDPLRPERVSSGVGGESGLAWMSVVSNGSGGVAMVEI